MGRPRINDPAGVSDNPVCVTDPVREAELTNEFRKKLIYLLRQFQLERTLTNFETFNGSLAHVKKIVADKADAADIGKMHMQIQLAIMNQAKEYANERENSHEARISGDDKMRAMELVASKLKPVMGKPHAEVLHRTVAGLMALAQETTGRPVMARKTRGLFEERHLSPGISQILLELQRVDPSITETQLANIVFRMRKKYKGRPMRFADFYPGYSFGPARIVYHTADGGRVDGGELWFLT